MSKKPRADSKLKTLPDARQEMIVEYLREHSLEATRQWLAEDGLQTSTAALSEFLSDYQLRAQLRLNESTVIQLQEDIKKDDPNYDPDKLFRIGQAMFSAMSLQQQDPKAWALTQQLNLKNRVLELDERKLILLEKKAAAFDQVKESINSGGITAETLSKIERELKLL